MHEHISLQMKFLNTRHPSDPASSPPSNPHRGASLPTSPVVVLNALGYIGFKVISTCGSSQVSNFTLEGLFIRRRTLAGRQYLSCKALSWCQILFCSRLIIESHSFIRLYSCSHQLIYTLGLLHTRHISMYIVHN